MSNMQSTVRAVIIADVHLSDVVPTYRSKEPDWIKAQLRVLEQVWEVAQDYEAPVLIAGDLFDKWKVSSELVAAILTFMNVYDVTVIAIPGQHDLPNHDLGQIHRSAYGVLAAAGMLSDRRTFVDLSGYGGSGWRTYTINDLVVYGFPWGVDLRSRKAFVKDAHTQNKSKSHVALLHQFVWASQTTTPKVLQNRNYRADVMNDESYDLIACGDHHVQFLHGNLLNCGPLIRRRKDDPVGQYHLLFDDNEIESFLINVEEDVYWDEAPDDPKPLAPELTDFLDSLRELAQDDDIYGMLRTLLAEHKVKKSIRKILNELLES